MNNIYNIQYINNIYIYILCHMVAYKQMTAYSSIEGTSHQLDND